MKTSVKKYHVHGTVTLPFSIEVDCENENIAQAIAQYQLNDLSIQQAYLTLLSANGDTITPKVHDHNIDVENIFED